MTHTCPPKPFAPIPSGLRVDGFVGTLVIRPLVIVFRPKAGPVVDFETDRSNVALARLREAARAGEEIVTLSHDGLDLDRDSIAALNCYLRTEKAMGRMKLPFDRIPDVRDGVDTIYKWAHFCEHLGLNFR